MIIGSVQVSENAITTHRDTYLLAHVSVVSVRRPFLSAALLIAGGLSGFTLAFADLLYAGEIITLASVIVFLAVVGSQLGQLKLLSRDLRGSDLSDAVWGHYGHLNAIRREIASKRHSLEKGTRP